MLRVATTPTTLTSAITALDAILPMLADLPEDQVIRPHTDPHAAAVTALLVADWLLQPEHEQRLLQVGLSVKSIRELARLSRAIVGVVHVLGGDYLSDQIAIPTEIEARGQAVRASTIKALEKALPWNRDVKMWLDAVKMGAGLVDLVYDLRTLADLLIRHREAMPANLERLPTMLRTASDAIEYALRQNEPEDMKIARARLARIWTFFVPAYERASTAARVLSREEGAERTFPPLALIASHRRARRRDTENDENDEDDEDDSGEADAIKPVFNETEEKTTSGRNTRVTGSRRAHRAVLELEVGIGESNFYVGFTENVSCAGVFVATYVMQPIGSKVDVVLTMPGGGETMRIPGIVRWQRAASEDGWPGMGVQFEKLSDEQEARIQRFLQLREPIFYDEEENITL